MRCSLVYCFLFPALCSFSGTFLFLLSWLLRYTLFNRWFDFNTRGTDGNSNTKAVQCKEFIPSTCCSNEQKNIVLKMENMLQLGEIGKEYDLFQGKSGIWWIIGTHNPQLHNILLGTSKGIHHGYPSKDRVLMQLNVDFVAVAGL